LVLPWAPYLLVAVVALRDCRLIRLAPIVVSLDALRRGAVAAAEDPRSLCLKLLAVPDLVIGQSTIPDPLPPVLP